MKGKGRGLRALCAALALVFTIGSAAALAAADPSIIGGGLMLSPTRIELGPSDRAATLRVINSGDEQVTFRLFWAHLHMGETGDLSEEDAPSAGEHWVDNLIVFAPRAVSVAPGGQQVVRLLIRRPSNLADGEYRSHLEVQAVPPADFGNTISQAVGADQEAPKGPTVKLTPVFGLAIPVIVRQGEAQLEMNISDVVATPPAQADGSPSLSLVLHRIGTVSAYGDLTVTLEPETGPPSVIGVIKGMAVYTPNATRRVEVPLSLPDGVQLSGAHLVISYAKQKDDGGAELAHADVRLP